ncbi:YitT family protein [Pseudoramibacter sp.]|jgi:uncharacterized membrane-anchored protein YitT (DUF2179 family)|uniref:YitT family protein n=1 Tax=Pseudoramibacter sp. TaxID=2034862 RepID=UPI0025E9AB3A|nr:YitT family protein [Pseudoramibacter sp.]MCH4072098.1 YitT family protein [Pseudoramibacter sp.]MCH4105868.1 YitT family protein [Pseudoramibacter sp.]
MQIKKVNGDYVVSEGRMNSRNPAVRILFLTASAVVTGIYIQFFLNPGHMYPGGVGGVTLLIQRIAAKFFHTAIPYAPINILLNLIPIYIGFKYLGKKFTAYSCYTIVLASLITDWLPQITITKDPLLLAVFGGVLGGVASVLCLWVHATAGGTDFISIFLSVKKGIDAWNIMLAFNVVILIIAGLLFGWRDALYSIIYQFTFTQVVKAMYHNYQQQTVLIVTDSPHDVSRAIYSISNHGATILKGTGSYLNQDRSVVYSIISRANVSAVIKAVREVDPNAFINSFKTERVYGAFYQEPTE